MSQLCDQNVVLMRPRLTSEVRLSQRAGGTVGKPVGGSVLGCCHPVPSHCGPPHCASPLVLG